MTGNSVDSFIDRDVMCFGERNPYTTASAVAWEMDPVAPWGVVIDAAHHQIHEDEAFSKTFTASAASNASGFVMFLTGSGATHFRISGIAASSDKLWLHLYQSQSASGISSASGYSASATSTNRNRYAATETGNVHWLTASGTVSNTSSTLLDSHFVGGAGIKAGASTAADEEWILKPSTVYAFHYINLSSGDNVFNVRTFEYTETA